MCVNYNSAPKTVITVHLFVIFLSQGIVGNVHSPEWGQPLLKKFSVVFFCSVLRDVHRCKSKNITGVDSARRQVSNQHDLNLLVTSWLQSLPVLGHLLWIWIKLSCFTWQYKTRQANRSQAESGHQAGGVSSLYFVLICPLPVLIFVCSSRTTALLQGLTHAIVYPSFWSQKDIKLLR